MARTKFETAGRGLVMDPQQVLNQLKIHLQGQRELFHNLKELQGQLLSELDSNQDMSAVLALLTRKNLMLDHVRAQNLSATTLVDSWPIIRKTLGDTVAVRDVQYLLGEVENLAHAMRKQDEEMIHRFEAFVAPSKPVDQDTRSRNLLNAFRALR